MKLFAVFLLLAGNALAQTTTHGVKLAWTQSTSTGIKLNTVYQSAVSGGPYTAIFTSTAPLTNYLVPLTTSNQGTSACFVVTATAQIESVVSNETCLSFPVPTAPVTALSASQQ